MLNDMNMKKRAPLIRPFRHITIADVPQVGGKNASLGEMFRRLTPKGIRVPDGFATTSAAYWRFLAASGLRKKIKETLAGLDVHDIRDLYARGAAVRKMILEAPLPKDVEKAIRTSYADLCKRSGGQVDVAVRSSATAEDLPGASFAGQQESYLNIRGEDALLLTVRRCYASLFTDRAIVYRVEQGFSHLKVALSVGVQRMVRSDLASAGVMFTIDTESGFRDAVVINAAYGLGESVVQGRVNPDQYTVFKPLLGKAKCPIIGRTIGSKAIRIAYGKSGGVKTLSVPAAARVRSCLTDKEILTLADWGTRIEVHYSKHAKHHQPMDIEWAKDGKTGKLFIVQARPETISTARDPNVLEEYVLTKKGRLLVDGLAIGSKIGAGRVHVIKDAKGIKKFRPGDVLVTRMTDPDWVPIMKQASAIITDSGGRTSHAAIVSRELGTPAVVGTGKATSVLRNGMPVTVTCAEGDEGRVYAGILPFHVRRVSLKKIKEPKTHVMMNIGDPRRAFEFAQIPSAGIGLARTEFIFTEYIKVHPLALVHFKDLRDPALRKKIEAITAGYDDKKQFLVDRLADGIAHLAAAFYPNDVIVRTSDFKTNEYAALLGGQAYEPVEANPMIGWRGASRYYDPKYKEAFALECKAIKKVREEMGLTNVVVMIPFCRTPEEGRRVLATMKAAGLPQGKNKLRVYVMVEIPSNIIQAEAFADIFDGFSIGSNDLTQLTLGVDRDSEIVRRLYDEHDEAVLASIRSVIRAAKKKKVKIGICGQAPSDDPTFAEFLVREGIDSISLNPDTVLPTRLRIAAMEQKLRRRRSKK